MKLVARRVAWLLPLLLSACAHNLNQSQMQPLAPPIEDTPPPPPDSAPANLPAPEYHIPKTDKPVIVVQGEPTKPLPKHRKPASKPANGAQGVPTPGQPNTQVANAEAPAEVSAIGQFATTEAPDKKREAADSISEVEKGLSGITRHLSDADEKTSTQIKEFIKQARAALATGDVEGAGTLASKAKVLLKELSQ